MFNVKKNIILYVIIAILGIYSIYSYIKISDLELSVLNNLSYYENESIALRNNISQIYNNVKEQLEKEASFLSHFEVIEGDVDTVNHKVKIELEVIPKELTSQTSLTLQYKGENYPFKRDDHTFKVSFYADLFDSYENREYGFVKIENGELLKIEKLEDMDLCEIYQRYIPYLIVSNFSKAEKSKNKVNIQLDATLHTPHKSEPYQIGYDEFYLVSIINNKMHKQNITTTIKSDSGYEDGHSHFNKELELNASFDDDIAVYIEAVDQFGYIHQHLIYANDEKFEAAGEGSEMIYDNAGNLLASRG